MDLWQRARSFAEEAAKKSQELTQGLDSANLSGVVSEASKRSKELAAEATKMSKELAAEALKRADQIKAQIPPPAMVLNNLVDSTRKAANEAADLEKFGITDELREFVEGITINTFRDFPFEDDSTVSDIATGSNVRQDLSEWQERHAKLVLSTVKLLEFNTSNDAMHIESQRKRPLCIITKEISMLRYKLCPRVMKERKFWSIYFVLVQSHVAPYEKSYMDDLKLNAAEKLKDTEGKETSSGARSEQLNEISKPESNNVKSASSEQDLDVFLLGDHEDIDAGPDDGNDGFDDDFDKL